MSATQTEKKTEYHCTCGRTFAHEISLKRHCWVTGHTAEVIEEAPVASLTPAETEITPVALAPIELPSLVTADVVDEAVRILREKQQAQHAYEVRQARERQVKELLNQASAVVQQASIKAVQTSRQGCDIIRKSSILALRLLLMILICSGLVLTGVGVGRLLASPADASQVSPSTDSVPSAIILTQAR